MSELLVSLTILGVISAITLPTIFNNVDAASRRAAMKETYQIIGSTIKDIADTGAVTDNIATTSIVPELLKRWNTKFYCDSTRSNPQCAGANLPTGYWAGTTWPVIILHNDVALIVINDTIGYIIIDPDGPHKNKETAFWTVFNATSTTMNEPTSGTPYRPGEWTGRASQAGSVTEFRKWTGN